DTRRARKLMSAASVEGGGRLIAVHGHNETQMTARIVERVRAGERVVYVSDAGMPGVADPGERLVRACAAAGLAVEVVPGPSAALAALVVSGLPTDRFAFEGFLPRKGRRRRERLSAVAGDDRTTVIFEAPHRITETLRDLADAAGDARPVAVVRELTKLHEEVWRGRLGDAADAVGEARGEYVVVLGGAPASEEVGADDVAAAVAEEMATGASARDVAATVAERLGVSRNIVYPVAMAARARQRDASLETGDV
ncbi:MAG TPA: 16S rRNA (cytidine(1402)-2'-O)-methyltransferase, partial [Acidimicrobiia bacterium]|nr:16S rRNA (cytidine(1402)-2'-O)-methyltransferase [Acidimicrobiia bacterium]